MLPFSLIRDRLLSILARYGRRGMGRPRSMPAGGRMHPGTWSAPTRQLLPVVLVRGFGGLGVEDEKKTAYQGFNDGTVYPGKRGENYIYEGLILRFLKSFWQYQDATNVVGYYSRPIQDPGRLPEELSSLDPGFFSGDKVVIDPGMALH